MTLNILCWGILGGQWFGQKNENCTLFFCFYLQCVLTSLLIFPQWCSISHPHNPAVLKLGVATLFRIAKLFFRVAKVYQHYITIGLW